MRKIISFVLLVVSVTLYGQSKLTTKDILSKELIYHFDGGDIRIIISSDTALYWRDDSKPREAHEQSKTTHINDYTIMTAWYESDKTFVTLLSDFNSLKVSGMICRPDGKFYPINGIIEVKL